MDHFKGSSRRYLMVWNALLLFTISLQGCQSDGDNLKGEEHASLPALQVLSSRIVDDRGRTVLFHGVNISNSNKFPNASGSFIPDSGRFLLAIQGFEGVTAPSEIRVPEPIYGKDFSIEISDRASWSFDPAKRILTVQPPAGGQIHTIEILP